MEISSRKLGRWTGLVYLSIILFGLLGSLFFRGAIVLPGDPAGTLQNLLASEGAYRLGFLSDLVMVISDVLIAILFYFLLKSANRPVAITATGFRMLQASVLGANLINLYTPLLLIQEPGADAQQLALAVMHSLQSFDYGYLISGVFFAVNCLLMGYLLYRSALFPQVLGLLIGLAGLGYLFNSLAYFVFPDLVSISEIVMFFTAVLAELALCLYLIIRGTKTDVQLEL